MNPNLRKTTAITSLSAALALSAAAQTGPMVGTVKTTEASFLFRPGDVEKTLRLNVLDANQQVVATSVSASDDADDFVAKFNVTGLQASTAYTYSVEDLSGPAPVLLEGPADGLRFRTRSPHGTKGVVTAAFASCANITAEPVWERMASLNLDQIVFCGDTPYVDVADLPTIRLRHRTFLETPFMRALIRGTSTVGTWDDHDFGLNNGNGVNAADRRENARKAFVEYRAHDQYGSGTEGVYHKVRLGPMDIFLLDPRWWSQTMASPVDPSRKTCYGPGQWAWIQQELAASKAPFKVIAIGEVWQDKKNSENDDQFTYWYERDALLEFIRSTKIPGVVLVGGDIHVSRHLVHRRRIDYDLHDFVTSPAHTSVIPSLDVTHPDLEWSSKEPRQFLTLTADTRVSPAVLTARFYLADGTIQREVTIPYDQLTPKQGAALGKDLRAWWSFDGNLANQAVTGPRFDATAVNGAALVADAGPRGGAVSFSRASQQYLRIGRQTLDDTPPLPERAGRWPLDDNSAAHTVSLWCKPASLPAHGGTDRSFLLESAPGGSSDPGYHLSLGFRAAETDASKINLELYTVTLQPAGSASTAAPTALAQGPFICELDRTVFTDRWAHVVVTFDSSTLRLHVGGAEVAAHALPTPGPAAETAGLIIGGHRAGTGRNFDGLIDEVALWSRVLTPADIVALHHSGSPQALSTEVSSANSDGDEVFESLTNPNVSQLAAVNWIQANLGGGGTNPGDIVLTRNESDNTLTFKLGVSESTTLGTWSPLTSSTPGVGASITGGEIRIAAPGTAVAKRFFRLGGEAP